MDEERIKRIENRLNMLESASTIPFPVEQAFRERFKLADFAELKGSTESPGDYDQAVDEAGAASYNVASVPDGFREFTVGGSTLLIPYYNPV